MKMKNKNILVLGVANEKSIAWGIVNCLKEQGANVALTFVNEQIEKRVVPLAESVKADFVAPLDVTKDQDLENLPSFVSKYWRKIDGIVHSLAFANREDLKGRFVETSREGYSLACDVSAYSLIAVSRVLLGLMSEGSSIVTLTYHGSQQVIPGYNVMGVAKAALEATARYLAYDLGQQKIRVNCISAGPMKTLASSAINGLRNFTDTVEQKSPLRENISSIDVGHLATFLLSEEAKHITGQTLYVDSGMSIMGA